MRVCRGGGVRFSVLCGWLQRFLVPLFLKVGVCVGGDCVCCLYAWVGCGCGWILAVGWVGWGGCSVLVDLEVVWG